MARTATQLVMTYDDQGNASFKSEVITNNRNVGSPRVFTIGEAVNRFQFDKSPGIVMPIYQGVNPGFSLSDGDLTKSIPAKSALIKYTIPPLVIGAVLHVTSLLKSFSDINEKNQNLVQSYASESMESISPERFLDFQEPKIVEN